MWSFATVRGAAGVIAMSAAVGSVVLTCAGEVRGSEGPAAVPRALPGEVGGGVARRGVTMVPEPGSCALLILGVASLTRGRRRRWSSV